MRVVADEVVDTGSQGCLEDRAVAGIVRNLVPGSRGLDESHTATDPVACEDGETARAGETLD